MPSVFLRCVLLMPLLPPSREKEGKRENPPTSSSLSHKGGKSSQKSFIYCSALNEHLSHLTPPPCSGNNTEEGMERLRVRRWGAAVKRVFWTYEAIALVSTRQLWLHKTKTLNFTAETEEGRPRLHPQLRSAWQLAATGRGRLFCLGV